MLTLLKNFIFIFFIVQGSACYFNDQLITDDLGQYQEVSPDTFAKLNKKIAAISVNPFSVASSVRLHHRLTSKSFEQVLISQGNSFRVTWYSPNYVQTLAYLVSTKEARRYCDMTISTCWNDLPKDTEIGGLETVLSIEGLNLSRIMTGYPINFTDYSDLKVLKKIGSDADYVVEGKNSKINFITHLKEHKNTIQSLKLFIADSERGRRIAEVEWEYSAQTPIDANILTPSKIKLNLLEQGVNIEMILKNFSKPNVQEGVDFFNLTPPVGFEIR